MGLASFIPSLGLFSTQPTLVGLLSIVLFSYTKAFPAPLVDYERWLQLELSQLKSPHPEYEGTEGSFLLSNRRGRHDRMRKPGRTVPSYCMFCISPLGRHKKLLRYTNMSRKNKRALTLAGTHPDTLCQPQQASCFVASNQNGRIVCDERFDDTHPTRPP